MDSGQPRDIAEVDLRDHLVRPQGRLIVDELLQNGSSAGTIGSSDHVDQNLDERVPLVSGGARRGGPPKNSCDGQTYQAGAL